MVIPVYEVSIEELIRLVCENKALKGTMLSLQEPSSGFVYFKEAEAYILPVISSPQANGFKWKFEGQDFVVIDVNPAQWFTAHLPFQRNAGRYVVVQNGVLFRLGDA